MPLPFPFVDNYADLESEALLILVPADKSTSRATDRSRENDAGKARGMGLGGRENEGDNAFNLLQSVLQNPLSALSEFNWRGERMMEQLQKHHVRQSDLNNYVMPTSVNVTDHCILQVMNHSSSITYIICCWI